MHSQNAYKLPRFKVISALVSPHGFARWRSLSDRMVKIYRWFRPIPTSPEPGQGEDPTALTLVPVRAVEDRIRAAIAMLQPFGEPVETYVEFGVYNGTSLIAAYRAFNSFADQSFKLFGFDSFQGLPPEAALEDGGVWREGQFRCPQERTVEYLRKADVPKDRYILIPGWFADTLTAHNRCLVRAPVSIVMIDCDAFSSALAALRFIGPLLSPHSIIFFDDWRLNNLDLRGMGEKRAFEIFLRENPTIHAQQIRSYNRKSNAFLLTRH